MPMRDDCGGGKQGQRDLGTRQRNPISAPACCRGVLQEPTEPAATKLASVLKRGSLGGSCSLAFQSSPAGAAVGAATVAMAAQTCLATLWRAWAGCCGRETCDRHKSGLVRGAEGALAVSDRVLFCCCKGDVLIWGQGTFCAIHSPPA